MRKIIVVTFATMDGVLQSPGGQHEDTTGGFKWGGWQAPFENEKAGEMLEKVVEQPFDLLLGRRTYEIFAAHWPYQHDEIGEKFNRITKYVVGTTDIDTSWSKTVQIKHDVVAELKKLKDEDGPNLLVHGSGVLVQTLLSNKLIDELHIWTHPLTLGKGKKLFAEGTTDMEWKVEDVAISNGVIMAVYTPAGEVRTSTFATLKPSEKEMERREKWDKED